jgi:hypothetical protein
MRYVFMHNFRGFSDTLLPLHHINFLVGENSTGKSSFLKLLYVLSRPHFWFSPEAPFPDEAELGGFNDMVSAWSSDKTYFQFGVLSSRTVRKTGKFSCSFSVHTFGNRDGSPYVSRYLQFSDGGLTKLVFQKSRTKYKTTKLDREFGTMDDVIAFFRDSVHSDREDSDGFILFPKNIPPASPIPIAVAILKSMDKGKPIAKGELAAVIPFSLDLTWIAPIRTRPQRFYDGMRKAFSPEGDHTPFILRRSLQTRSKTGDFAEKLRVFGDASGLFEAIIPHPFDKSPQSPFEILVRFCGADLNVSNVGYGVSQVLPLVVEFLSKQKNRAFAVQQPEVHLHPRAQAALGDLIAEVAAERGHRFMLETHSDYLIDRCRLNLSKHDHPVEAQTIFFQRTAAGNRATVLPIGKNGRYPDEQPPEFRAFFVREEMNLLEV